MTLIRLVLPLPLSNTIPKSLLSGVLPWKASFCVHMSGHDDRFLRGRSPGCLQNLVLTLGYTNVFSVRNAYLQTQRMEKLFGGKFLLTN